MDFADDVGGRTAVAVGSGQRNGAGEERNDTGSGSFERSLGLVPRKQPWFAARYRRWLALLLTVFLVLPTVIWGVPVLASSTPAVISRHFQHDQMRPLVPVAGRWSVGNGVLSVDNFNLSAPLPKQFAYVNTSMRNEVVLAEVTIVATPGTNNWRVGIFAHGTGSGSNSQKWALILRGGKLSLLDENTAWIRQIPFSSSPGQTYFMELAVNGTTVNGRVWSASQTEPPGWTITGTFPPNAAQYGTNAGLYVANADAAFSSFQVRVAPPVLRVTPKAPGAIFQQGDQAGYAATLTNSSNRGASYRIAYTVDNLAGNVVESGSVPATVPPLGVTNVDIPVSLPRLGYYTIAFQLTAVDGFPLETLPVSSLCAVPPPTLEPAVQNPVGMNGNLTFNATYGTTSQVSSAFTALAQQGIGWYRLNLNARSLAIHAGDPNWQATDRIVKSARGQHIQLLGLLTGWPMGIDPFGAHPSTTFTQALNSYLSYVRQVVNRYRPGGFLPRSNGWTSYGISTWEIWNEPVTPQFWGGTAAEYHTLAQATAQTIRSIEPGATILAYADQPANLVNSTPPGLLSGLSAHYYPGAQPPDNPTFSVYGMVKQDLNWTSQLGGSLWITEAGWSTHRVSPATEASNWVETVLDGLTAGASHVLLFSQIYPGSGFSEEYSNLTPKVAYPALAELNHRLVGFHPIGRFNLGSSLIADAFSNGGNTLVTLWSPTQSGSLTLPRSPTPMVAYGWMGNPINPNGQRLTVPISSTPVYLEFYDTNPQMAEGLLHLARESNLPPFSLTVGSKPQSSATPVVTVTVTNVANRPQGGTLTLTLPSGWTGVPQASTTAAATYAPSLSIGPISVGGQFNAVFELTAPYVPKQFKVVATMSGQNGAPSVSVPQTLSNVAPSRQPALVRRHPRR